MADIDVSVTWKGTGLELIGRGRAGVEIDMDGDTRTGISPVESLLVSLAACMAADVVDIGTKMRLSIESLEVQASGMRNPEPPRRFLSARLVFHVSGVPAQDEASLQRAIDLSRDKYCSVMHTLRPDMQLTIELVRIENAAATERSE